MNWRKTMIKVKTLVMPIGITTTLSNHYASANVEERYVKNNEKFKK